MTKWIGTIDLSSFFHNDSLDIAEKATLTANAIRKHNRHNDDDLECFAQDFSELTTVQDFDMVLSELYDYADEQRIWIATV